MAGACFPSRSRARMRPTSSSTGEFGSAGMAHDAPRRRGLATPPRVPSSERVTDGEAEHPRTQWGLFDDELVGADEHARVRVAQVLGVQIHVPVVLRDADGGI